MLFLKGKPRMSCNGRVNSEAVEDSLKELAHAGFVVGIGFSGGTLGYDAADSHRAVAEQLCHSLKAT